MIDRVIIALPSIVVLVFLLFDVYKEHKNFKRKNCTTCRWFNKEYKKCELLCLYDLDKHWQCRKWEGKEGEEWVY